MKSSSPARARRAATEARCERLREEILDQAIDLFARDGYADTDLQLLADQLGVGKGTLYRHFGNKEKLFLAAVDRVMSKLRSHIDGSVEGLVDPLDRIRRGIHSYLQYFADHPEAVEMFIQERAQFKDRKKPTYFAHREANVEKWRDLYRDLIAEGRVRSIPAEQISDLIHDLLYGTMFVSYIVKRDQPPAVVADNIIDIVFNGILSDAERRGRARPRNGLVN